jgi:hypothetical protein
VAVPILSPISTVSAIVLPVTGTKANVTGSLPFGVYTGADFISGAVDQVAFTYRKLCGDVLDVELTANNVYAAYEEAVLEYSYLINIHQNKNVLSDLLGSPTGTFDSDGELQAGALATSLSGTGAALRFPKFDFAYARRIAQGISSEAAVGGNTTFYSASIDIVDQQQDYDLQSILSSSIAAGNVPYSSLDPSKKFTIRKVFFKSPRAMWRFYGYYGGINIVGNLSTYGQYADDSTFQVIPVWQNKLQAMAYEDSLYTRVSHYSYELRNNKIRLFPNPSKADVDKIWFEFTVDQNPLLDEDGIDTGTTGVNNMNTTPFANIPYVNINSIGKQWIRRFALSLCKEMLGLIRGKFTTIPIPGESVTLNADALLSQAKEEQTSLRDELKTILDEMTYEKLVEGDATLAESTQNLQAKIPLNIFVG